MQHASVHVLHAVLPGRPQLGCDGCVQKPACGASAATAPALGHSLSQALLACRPQGPPASAHTLVRAAVVRQLVACRVAPRVCASRTNACPAARRGVPLLGRQESVYHQENTCNAVCLFGRGVRDLMVTAAKNIGQAVNAGTVTQHLPACSWSWGLGGHTAQGLYRQSSLR